MIFSMMEHRSIKYDVRQIELSKWIWIIRTADGGPIIDENRFPNREMAIAAAVEEINSGQGGVSHAARAGAERNQSIQLRFFCRTFGAGR
jgi:hypothetical protein